MSNLIVYALIFAISAGQLIKIPIAASAGPILLDITVLILCVVGIFKSRLKLKTPPLFIKAGLIFTFICIASLAFTPLHLNNLEYIASFSYILRFFCYLFLGWLLYSNIFPGINKSINQILIYSGFILAVLGILQFFFYPNLIFLTINGWDPHYFRTVSTFLDPNFLGGYLSLILLILMVHQQDPIPSKWRILFFLIIYFALVTSFSRGGILVLIVSFSMLAILQRSFKIALLTAVLAIGFGVVFFGYQQQIANPRHIDREQSAEYRLGTWQQGLKMFQQSPILGIGFNSYPYGIREYNLANTDFVHSRGSSSNDSSLVHVAATTGIIGLIAYLFFLLTIFLSGKKPLVMAGLAGILVQSFFSNTLFYPFLLMLIILIVVKSE